MESGFGGGADRKGREKMKCYSFGSVPVDLHPGWPRLWETLCCYLSHTRLTFPAAVLVTDNLQACSGVASGLQALGNSQVLSKPDIPDLVPDQMTLSWGGGRGGIKGNAL